jgi:peptidyl-dipeptidase Dcp
VRAAEYDLDRGALRPWFEAERVLQDGVFRAATQLYGVTFAEREDLSAYHPDARVFEVSNADGSPVGLFILDLYTRDTKRGGAWMNSIVSQSRLRGTLPIVVNNLNVPKPAAGKPTLLTLDEVTTLFHEFGHALHGLFATVTYPHFAGTNVFRDFVEFPSQVNEMWIYWPEILDAYARHAETGEPLPRDVVEKLRASEAFNQGFATSEYLAASWLDQAWHSLSAEQAASDIDVAAFEAAALREIGLDNPAVPTRYSSTYFAHIFSGGYSAGYYSYIWSEVLDADTVEWFRENGGLTRANGDRFRDRLLGVGGSKDPLEAYRDFRGRDAEIEPLLERRGLAV